MSRTVPEDRGDMYVLARRFTVLLYCPSPGAAASRPLYFADDLRSADSISPTSSSVNTMSDGMSERAAATLPGFRLDNETICKSDRRSQAGKLRLIVSELRDLHASRNPGGTQQITTSKLCCCPAHLVLVQLRLALLACLLVDPVKLQGAKGGEQVVDGGGITQVHRAHVCLRVRQRLGVRPAQGRNSEMNAVGLALCWTHGAR